MSFKYWFPAHRTLLIAVAIAAAASFAPAQSSAPSRILARGGGKTIIEGGTGAPGGFVPVITTIAFHAEQRGQTISGDFECLALMPPVATGNGSGQFTVNAMYVTGEITSAQVQGDTATLKGTANITGLGAGSGVPFTLVVRRGGPGATSVLTTQGLVFKEILLEGSFDVDNVDNHD